MTELEAMRGTEIKHLAALAAVGRERSFRAAAKRCGCAQSVLSQHVAELESALGTRLVDRADGARGARLTEAGTLMLAHADVVLARVAAARADLRTLGGSSPLRVGVYESVAARVMPRILAAVGELEVEPFEADDAETLPECVARAEVDVAFAHLPLPDGPFAWATLLEERYVLLVAADSELTRRMRPPDLEEVTALPLLAPAGRRAAERVAAELAAAGWRPRFVQRPGSDASLRALVRTGAGAAVVPALSVDPSDPGTVAIDLRGLLSTRTLALVWHRYRRDREEAAWFRDVAGRVCDAIARSERGWGPSP